MLDAFWRTNSHPTSRIHEAAHQYGPYAVACLTAVALELLVVILVSIDRVSLIGWLATVVEAGVVLSLWWAIIRYRAIKREISTNA